MKWNSSPNCLDNVYFCSLNVVLVNPSFRYRYNVAIAVFYHWTKARNVSW